MTDIELGADNDLVVSAGQLLLIQTKEVMVRQRLLNKLRAFTGTLFTNQNYGIDSDFIGSRGQKEVLDEHLKSLIIETKGVLEMISFEGSLNKESRTYSCQFKYLIDVGEISGISLLFTNQGIVDFKKVGIWRNGYWIYNGSWENDAWGSVGY